MSDDYKYKNLPRAANGIAPAQWDEKKKEWVPYDGINDVNIKNLKEVTDEINDIKATQAKILERLDKPLDTQVTGSNVGYRKVETILPRKVRSTRYNNASFTQPNWANMAIFYLTVYGISGTFEEGEGILLDTLLFGIDSARYYGASHERSTTARITQITEWSPGLDASNVDVRGGSSYMTVPVHFVSDVGSHRIRAQITGTFADDEGIDCDIRVAWLRG